MDEAHDKSWDSSPVVGGIRGCVHTFVAYLVRMKTKRVASLLTLFKENPYIEARPRVSMGKRHIATKEASMRAPEA